MPVKYTANTNRQSKVAGISVGSCPILELFIEIKFIYIEIEFFDNINVFIYFLIYIAILPQICS